MPIKLLDQRSQIIDVAERWAKRYPLYRADLDSNKERIKQELFLLDRKTAAVEDIDRIIGVKGWIAEPECDNCGAKSYQAVQIGQVEDYDSRTATVCKTCLKQALNIMKLLNK